MHSWVPRSPALFVCTPVMDCKFGRLTPAMQDARRDNAHLGVYLLLGHLRRAGCDCDVLDWVAESPEMSEEDVAHIASQYRLVFFSCNSMNWAAVRLVAERVRQLDPTVKLCIGGPHPTMYPAAVAASGLFDAYFRGEADRVIAYIYEALLDGKPLRVPIQGLWAPSLSADDEPQLFQDNHLEELDWHVDYARIPAGKFLSIPVETSRGCKYRCAFCSIPSKNNWRPYPVEIARQQLEYARSYVDTTRYGKISIIDDTFTTNHRRIIDLCANLPLEPFQRRLMFDATLVDLGKPELVAAIKPFVSDLLVGAEVSTIADAKKITKPTGPKLIYRAAANLRDAGIASRAVFSFIIGFPWQTVNDCLETVTFLTNLILDYGVRVYLQWYWPMPGSDIWRSLEAEGRVHIGMADTPGFYRSPTWFYSMRKVTPEDLRRVDDRIRPLQM